MTILQIDNEKKELVHIVQWLDILHEWAFIAENALTYETYMDAKRKVDEYTIIYNKYIATFLLKKTQLL